MQTDERRHQKPKLTEELYKKTERWTYKGKPTKKARKLTLLEQRAEGILDAYEALLKREV